MGQISQLAENHEKGSGSFGDGRHNGPEIKLFEFSHE